MEKPTRSPAGTRRQQQKAETRELILEAARRLFEEHGFDGTTMRAVAAAAGVGLGTIFSHFPDKGALLIDAVLDDLARADEEILATLPADEPIKQQIMHMASIGYGYWCRRPALSAALLREMWFVSGPAASKRRHETAGFIEFGCRLLEIARERGELRADADLQVTADVLYSFYVGSLIRAAGDGRFEVKALLGNMEAFVDQLLEGVGASSPCGTDYDDIST